MIFLWSALFGLVASLAVYGQLYLDSTVDKPFNRQQAAYIAGTAGCMLAMLAYVVGR